MQYADEVIFGTLGEYQKAAEVRLQTLHCWATAWLCSHKVIYLGSLLLWGRQQENPVIHQDPSYPEYLRATEQEAGERIPGYSWILQTGDPQLCRNSTMVMSEPRRKQPCELGGQSEGEIPNTQERLVSAPTLGLPDTDNPFHLWVGDIG